MAAFKSHCTQKSSAGRNLRMPSSSIPYSWQYHSCPNHLNKCLSNPTLKNFQGWRFHTPHPGSLLKCLSAFILRKFLICNLNFLCYNLRLFLLILFSAATKNSLLISLFLNIVHAFEDLYISLPYQSFPE